MSIENPEWHNNPYSEMEEPTNLGTGGIDQTELKDPADGRKVGMTPEQLANKQNPDANKLSDRELIDKGASQAKKATEIANMHAEEERTTKTDDFPPEAMMAWGVPDASETPSSGVSLPTETNNNTSAT